MAHFAWRVRLLTTFTLFLHDRRIRGLEIEHNCITLLKNSDLREDSRGELLIRITEHMHYSLRHRCWSGPIAALINGETWSRFKEIAFNAVQSSERRCEWHGRTVRGYNCGGMEF